MAVYTNITTEQLSSLLDDYDVGALISYEGIEKGVSNSNYHVFTEKGRYVLTLFEPRRVDAKDVPFFMGYADHLSDAGIPAPAVLKRNDGKILSTLADKPAVLVRFLEGQDIPKETIAVQHCREAGALLARMHLAGDDYEPVKGNDYGPDKWEEWGRSLSLNKVKGGLKGIVMDEVKYLAHHWPKSLSGGVIHADFFPDNVFFNADNKACGVIDFHFACTDFYIYDVAIALNAWCFDRQIMFSQDFYDAFIEGYQTYRVLTKGEWRVLPIFLRAAALRFLLSRAEEWLHYEEGDAMTPHDPRAFLKRLEYFQHA